MLYAVHTRKIVDPILGAKLTGSAGRVTFGSLTAIDQAPGRTETELDPLTAGKAVSGGPGADEPERRQLRGCDGDDHRARRPDQPHGRRGSQPEFQGLEPRERVRDRIEYDRRRRQRQRDRPCANYGFSTAPRQPADAGRALRPRLRDGHGVSQPGRHHVGLGLRGLQLLSRQGSAPVDPQDHPVHVRPARPRSDSGRRRLRCRGRVRSA